MVLGLCLLGQPKPWLSLVSGLENLHSQVLSVGFPPNSSSLRLSGFSCPGHLNKYLV